MEMLLQYWPIIGAIIGLVVWGVRLESLANMNKKETEHINLRIDRLDSDIKVALSKIDGRLETIATSLERVIWRIPRDAKDDRNKPDE